MALYQCPRIEYEVLPVEWTIAAGLYRSTQISFGWLTCLHSCQSIDELIVLGLEYIQLALHFVEEVLQTYENWNGKDGVPPKLQELMMLLEIEVSDRYK